VAAVVLVAVAALATATWWVLRGSPEPEPGPSPTTTTPTTAAPTTAAPTTTVPLRTAPLTGLPTVREPRRVVAVKVDAAPNVTRFSGLESADLVYEVLVEGGITRQLALFESRDAERVGPVRSVRTSDLDLVANLGDPIVVFSGADDLTLDAALAALDTPFTESSAGAGRAFTRDRSLRAPHNLFVSTAAVRTVIDEPGTVRAPLARGPAPAGVPVPGVRIAFSPATTVGFRWDGDRGEWLRERNGRPLTDDRDVQLGVDSVLVLSSTYTSPPWDRASPQLESVGSGSALLFTGGALVPLRWRRTGPASPFELTGGAGTPVSLPPGRTWVAFAPPDAASVPGVGDRAS
jgi:hypothetical protein